MKTSHLAPVPTPSTRRRVSGSPGLALPGLLLAACSAAPALLPDLPVEPVVPEAALETMPRFPIEMVDPAGPESCARRRGLVARALGDGALVVCAGPEGEGRYQPEDDFHWLTGVDTPGAVLILTASGGEAADVRLLLPDHDERHELWNGPRLAPGSQASDLTGIADTVSLEELDAELERVLSLGGELYARGEPVEGKLSELGAEWKQAGSELLAPIQMIKDEAEIAAQRAVIDITQAALADAMAVAVAGRHEYTAEAAVESGFRARGAQALAFPSICGAGRNTCYLHYRSNEGPLLPGELLVMDVGAKLHHYCADVTRTIPVDGTFSPRQREVYTLVYVASRRAASALRPGATLQDAHQVAVDTFAEHGFDRGDFPHSVGHGLGLRVHDWPKRDTPLEPGMIVTIEPGLYLPGERIGVRIEDDYLITDDGAELLSDALPSHPDELEAFLARIRGSG